MADDLIPPSPTSVKLITKRKSRNSKRYGFNKRNRFTINEKSSTKDEELSSSITINSNDTPSAAAMVTTNATTGNQHDCSDTTTSHIIKTTINLSLPPKNNTIDINYLYDELEDLDQQSLYTRGFGNDNSDEDAECIDNEEMDVFACAKLLEIANKQAITPKNSKSTAFNNITGKFISLNEHSNHNHHLHKQIIAKSPPMTIVDENIDPNKPDICQINETSQLILTNCQIGQLYNDADNAECENDNIITTAKDTSPSNSLKRSIKDIILCDFNVNSPSPIRSQKELCLFALHQSDDENNDIGGGTRGEKDQLLNIKNSTTLKTYSKIREEKSIKRKLFENKSSVPSSPSPSISSLNSRRSSLNYEWQLSDLSDNDCNENECGNTLQKRIITSSPALDLNQSQNLIENIQNLSSYYESQSTEKNKHKKPSLFVIDSEEYTLSKASVKNCDSGDDDNENDHVTLKTNFQSIILKSISSDDDDGGDNHHDIDADDDENKTIKPKILQINDSNIYKTFLDEDSDLFRQFISPGKIKNDNLQIKLPTIHETGTKTKSMVADSILNSACDSTGFTTGRGKQIPTTNDNLKKSINFFNEDYDLTRKLTQSPAPLKTAASILTNGNGFSTGRGTKITISATALEKSTKIFDEENLKSKKLENIGFQMENKCLGQSSKQFDDNREEQNKNSTEYDPTSSKVEIGFSTGRGNQIKLSENSKQLAEKMFNECSNDALSSVDKNVQIGFSTCRRNQFKLSDNSKQLAEQMFNECLNDPLPSVGKNIQIGFSTGRGNEIKMCGNSKKLAEKMFIECSNGALPSVDKNIQIGFSTGRGNQVKMSANAKLLAEKMFNDCSNEISSEIVFSTGRQHQPSNRIHISNNAQKRANNLFNNNDSEVEIEPRNKIPLIQYTKFKIDDKHKNLVNKLFQDCLDNDLYINKTITTTPQQPIRSGRFSWNDHPHKQNPSPKLYELETPTNNRRSIAFSMSQEITASTKALLEDEEESYRKTACRPIRLSARFSMAQDYDDNENHSTTNLINNQPSLSPMISESVRLARHLARQQQIETIKEINGKPIQARPGSLYLKKLISTKKKWHELVSNEKPMKQNIQHKITTENIDNFHFNMLDYLPEEFCMENTKGIQLSDGIVVHMNNENQITFTELEMAFLSCLFVDQKLLHKKWCHHHLQFIILKLASMEYGFPHLFPPKSILNLENVMLQLKYRYDREIDNAEQSVLRKIIEFNNASTNSMILYVNQLSWRKFHNCSDFGFGEENLRIELSDGWYKIPAKIDESLEKMVKCGKIKIGTKLIVNGAEILGLNKGCSPFEIPSNVRLNIHGNSTRRCRWDTKLGFYKHQNSLKISLNSILPNGGLIGRLIVSILRISPVMYVGKLENTTDNSKIVISERVYRRKEKQEDKKSNLLETIEKLYSQVTKEYEYEEEKDKNEYSKLVKNQKLCEINDPDELFCLFKNSNDPESFELELTNVQKEQLNEYQQQKNQEKNEEIQRRVREKLNNNNNNIVNGGGAGGKSAITQRELLTRFIKMRIIDAKQPKKSAILTIWNPNDDLLELLKEKQTFEIKNVSATGIRYGDLQLTAGKRTNYKHIELSTSEKNAQTIIKNLYRKVIQIDEIHKLFPNFRPQFNEFDTVGIIVSIGQKSMLKKSFQPIYIVDKNKKLLCINFWDGIDSLGYDDLIKIGNLLAIKNLQWRTMSSTEQLPKSFASEYSIFSSSVKQEHQYYDNKDKDVFYQTFIELQNFIKTINLQLFIYDCQTNLENILSASSSLSSSISGLSTPNNLKQINTLNNFNSTPPTPKIMSPALYASTPITRTSSPLVQRNNNTFSHTSTLSTTSFQNRIDRLNAYGQPPPISPIVFSKRNNFLFNRRLTNKTKLDKNNTTV